MSNLSDHITNLIEYMDENVKVDGMYKVTVLKAVAEYYRALTEAQSMEVVLRNMFTPK